MSNTERHPSPTWKWDEEYETNIRACPEGYTYVKGFRDRDGTSHAGYCRKLKPHEKSRTVEKVRREMEYNKTVNRAIEESGTLSDAEWKRKYGHLNKRRKK